MPLDPLVLSQGGKHLFPLVLNDAPGKPQLVKPLNLLLAQLAPRSLLALGTDPITERRMGLRYSRHVAVAVLLLERLEFVEMSFPGSVECLPAPGKAELVELANPLRSQLAHSSVLTLGVHPPA
jgi:hypothetical protein